MKLNVLPTPAELEQFRGVAIVNDVTCTMELFARILTAQGVLFVRTVWREGRCQVCANRNHSWSGCPTDLKGITSAELHNVLSEGVGDPECSNLDLEGRVLKITAKE